MAGFFEQLGRARAESVEAQSERANEVVAWFTAEKARIKTDPDLDDISREAALFKLNREFMKRSRASRRG